MKKPNYPERYYYHLQLRWPEITYRYYSRRWGKLDTHIHGVEKKDRNAKYVYIYRRISKNSYWETAALRKM